MKVRTSRGIVIGGAHYAKPPEHSNDAERLQQALLTPEYRGSVKEIERYRSALADRWVTRVCIAIAVGLVVAGWLGSL